MHDEKYPETGEDGVFGAKTVRGVYEAAGGGAKKFTVPILVDKESKEIVNNESSEIVRMFNSSFQAFAKRPELDLYPEDLRATIDAVNEDVYHNINDGVYKVGFARTQEAYDKALEELYAALERCELILSTQRYLASPDRFTEADLRLYVTLVRFDEVYITHFKCTKGAIREFPVLRNYLRDLYAIPALRDTTNMRHIKDHYYRSHLVLNPYSIVPASSPVFPLDGPHDRDALGPADPRLHA
jgi:glutathionyl-hydroquinone reductase